jgi:hypothetical protein
MSEEKPPDPVDVVPQAVRQPNMGMGICWECGEERLCYEFVVCCAGTIFRLCPECEAKDDLEELDK